MKASWWMSLVVGRFRGNVVLRWRVLGLGDVVFDQARKLAATDGNSSSGLASCISPVLWEF